jgi:predicted transcriptional regulator
MTALDRDNLVSASGRVVAAYVSHNALAPADLSGLIDDVHRTLTRLSNPAEPLAPSAPAVPVRRSVRHDRIVCLECGLAFKSLKRHLRVQHDQTPDSYRAKWSLAHDYPVVAPDYASRRSELAKSFGLGRKRLVTKSTRTRA